LLLLFLLACKKKLWSFRIWCGELAGDFFICIQLWKPYKHDRFCKHNVEDILFHCKNILLACV
jgi:hypothetical protein